MICLSQFECLCLVFFVCFTEEQEDADLEKAKQEWEALENIQPGQLPHLPESGGKQICFDVNCELEGIKLAYRDGMDKTLNWFIKGILENYYWWITLNV